MQKINSERGDKKVLFFPVKNQNEKLEKIPLIARKHFQSGEKLLILVENQTVETYIDELLWKVPSKGFLPHEVASQETDQLIVITKSGKNLNGSYHIFNLTASPLLDWEDVKLIYELDDQMTEEKKEISKNKYKAYREKTFFIESH